MLDRMQTVEFLIDEATIIFNSINFLGYFLMLVTDFRGLYKFMHSGISEAIGGWSLKLEIYHYSE